MPDWKMFITTAKCFSTNTSSYRNGYPGHIFDLCMPIEEKINFIKDNKDHRLYSMFKDYPNPEIRFECVKDENCNEISVALKYLNFKLLN